MTSTAAPGYWRRHAHKGKRAQHGKPYGVGRMTNRTLVRASSGRHEVTERLVVPMKPGNAGGGKGPWFRTNAKT
jgi:hypothetical protein